MFFKKLFQEIKDVTIPLYKILIPFIFIIKFLEIIGVVDLIAKLFEPLMILIGMGISSLTKNQFKSNMINDD